MADQDDLHVILGAGAVGRALAARLLEEGRAVRVVTRSGRADVDTSVVRADVSNHDEARGACADAAVVFGSVGLDYPAWVDRWPAVMAGMLAGAAGAGARFVFMDNLYMYGPVSVPMVESMPLTDYGRKPAVRARITRMWRDAHAREEVRAAAVRASDFYGPGVTLSAVGELTFGRVAAGKSARVLGDPTQPRSFSYVPDVARALVTVADAGDDAFGQAWHVPNASPISTRELVERFAAKLGRTPSFQRLGRPMLRMVGLFDGNARELPELLYQWDRPFVVDSSKFESRFWADATPADEGLSATARWYRDRHAAAT